MLSVFDKVREGQPAESEQAEGERAYLYEGHRQALPCHQTCLRDIQRQ